MARAFDNPQFVGTAGSEPVALPARGVLDAYRLNRVMLPPNVAVNHSVGVNMLRWVRRRLSAVRKSGGEGSRPELDKEKDDKEENHIAVERGGQTIRCRFVDFDDFSFENGDRLSVVTNPETERVVTPDSCVNVRTARGPIRIPPVMEFGEFDGYRLPLHLVLLTGAGLETLGPIGAAHVSNYDRFMGFPKGASVMEIGCGIGRDAFQLLKLGPAIRDYVGIDVTRDSIVWCQKAITARHSNFHFYHFDAKHELYNPLGNQTSLDFRLPAADRSVDRIFLGSVFTHLFEEEVTHYMREISRVLRTDGMAYATIFLYSPETIEAARRTLRSHNQLTFEHEHGDGCYVSDAQYPTGSVAFTDAAMRRMMGKAQLKLARPYLHGWWSGYFDDAVDGQEVALLAPEIRS